MAKKAMCLHLKGVPVARSMRHDGCVHLQCQIAAGFKRPVTAFNENFQYERKYNWLRFIEREEPKEAARKKLAAIYWAAKRDWFSRGCPVQDTFSMAFVYGAVS